MPVTPDAAVPPLIAALMQPRRYAHAVDAVELIETHISWVLLAGDWVGPTGHLLDASIASAEDAARRVGRLVEAGTLVGR